MKFILVFVVSALAFFLFFYLYPAAVFESKIIGINQELVGDLSLKSILSRTDLPDGLNIQNITKIQPTFSGFLILFICVIGLPLMIAYRFTLNNKSGKKQSLES